MEKYTIINKNGSEDSVSKSEFYKTLSEGNHYHYESGSVHVLLPETEENKEIYLVSRRDEQAEAKRIERMTRCLDEKGNICMGNCSGAIKKKGKIVGFKGECPKYAKRPNRTTVSLDERLENGHDESDRAESFELSIEEADVVEAFRAKLRKVAPELLPIADALLEGESVKEQADKLSTISPGLTSTASYQQIHRKYSRLIKEAEKFQKELTQDISVTNKRSLHK